MKILVLSCDKNDDTFEAFHHCMEKYYPEHPEVIYATETIINPYYKTITKKYPLNLWTKRIRETVQEIEDDKILLMIDDCFIREPVDTQRIEYLNGVLKGNIAMFNFEKSFDASDEETDIIGIKKRKHPSIYEVSLLCGLWQKQALIDILQDDSDPWTVEGNQKTHGYDFYINSGDYIINWGYETWRPAGLFKGLWCKEVVDFFKKEGVEIDYGKRGFAD